MKQNSLSAFLFYLLLFSFNFCLGQKTDTAIPDGHQIILDKLSGHTIIRYQLGDEQITSVEIDSVHQQAYLSVLRSQKNGYSRKGHLLSLELGKSSILWKTDWRFDTFSGSGKFFLTKNNDPLLVDSFSVSAFKWDTGLEQWSIKGWNFFLHPNRKLVLGASASYLNSMWNTESGKELWRYDTPYDDLRNGLFVSDSCMVFLEKGIHHVNLYSGATWSVEDKRLNRYEELDRRPGRGAVVGASTVLFGLVGGAAAILLTKGPTSVGAKADNYLFEDEYIYVTGTYVNKFDHSGNLVWKSEFNASGSGFSSIISIDTILVYINYGYRFNKKGRKVPFGEARCALIDKKTGKSIVAVVLPTKGENYFKDFVIVDDKISFLGQSSIVTLSLDSLKSTGSNEFSSPDQNIGLSNFVDPSDYLKTGNKYVVMADTLGERLFIRNASTKLIEFNSNLEIENIHSINQAYTVIDSYKDFKLISNGSNSVLIDQTGQAMYGMTFTTKARIKSGYLLDLSEDKSEVCLITL